MSRPPFYILNSTFYILLLFLAACGGNNTTPTPEGHETDSVTATTDTADSSLAILPTIDCLPYYLAAREQLYDSLGVKVRLLSTMSQWDCDTAIKGRTQAVGLMDSLRLTYRQRIGNALEVVDTTMAQGWAAVACGQLRLKKIEQLKGRTIATARHSVADHCIATLLKMNGTPTQDALLPQINDIAVRAKMLDGDQVNAALLPEPYVTAARAKGHNILWKAPAKAYAGRLVATRPTTQQKNFRENWQKVQKAVAIAATWLNQKGLAAARTTLQKDYRLPTAAIDSLRLPRF